MDFEYTFLILVPIILGYIIYKSVWEKKNIVDALHLLNHVDALHILNKLQKIAEEMGVLIEINDNSIDIKYKSDCQSIHRSISLKNKGILQMIESQLLSIQLVEEQLVEEFSDNKN